MAGTTKPTVDDDIAGIPAPLDGVASALREAVLAGGPDAKESVRWGQPVYESDGPFAALEAYPRWVTLTLWRGAKLAEADPLLGGEGDRMRHLRFASIEEVRSAGVAGLVHRAVELNRDLGDPTKRG